MKYVLIPLLPFAAFLIIGLCGHWIRERAHWIAVTAVFGSLLLSLWAFIDVAQGEPITMTLYSWISSGTFKVDIGFYIDRLTVAMLLLVTIVSGLVHIYTIGYMHGESGYPRFFAYIALFTFSMLMLVMADNFLLLYVFWEAVGLCSYLLIGHWYDRKSANDAATKAFVVNRVGDFGFGLGVMLIFAIFGTLQYQEVFAGAASQAALTLNVGGHWQVGVLTMICLLLFAGAVGKSAQFPLHVWLPDAMEGPTPISALIHAATMVTAGVFMVARLAPLYNLSPAAMDVVAVTGGFTAIFAATIAITQNDIKRVVAYSTVSQLGYMMMACGLGVYTAGMYHLLTHGAFKALLFLGCGSVIIALHHEQDIRRMGGLKDKLPITYWTLVIGTLALTGFPLTAGYFSKDAIIAAAYVSNNPMALYAFGTTALAAALTSFYSWRLIFKTFHGSPHDPHHYDAARESPMVMLLPLVFLAVGSIFAGYPFSELFIGHDVGEFFRGSLKFAADNHILENIEHVPHLAAMAPTVLMAIGFVIAWEFYIRRPELPVEIARQQEPLYKFLLNKWYFDEIYDFLIVRPTLWLARALWKYG